MEANINQRILPVNLKEDTHSRGNKFFLKTLGLKNLMLLFYFLITVVIYSQPVTKVVISGLSGYTSHDTDVKNAFLSGYSSYDGTQFPGQVDLHVDNDAISAISYADQNNYQIVVRSTTGLSSTVNDEAKKYPKVLLFMPAGSNAFIYVCNIDIATSAVVSTGAGLDTLVTGYKVEFFGVDPITNSNLASFSNGYIAGQIAFLANYFNITPQQARIVARYNASVVNQSTNYVQYGKINLTQAVETSQYPLFTVISSFTGSFTFTGSINKLVTLKWGTSQEYNVKGWDIERADLSKRIGGTGTLPWLSIGFVIGSGTSNTTKEYTFIDRVTFNTIIQYRLKQYTLDGSITYSNVLEINTNVKELKNVYVSNYPNPFNPTTNIEFSTPEAGNYTLKVYNTIGQEVATLVAGQLAGGSHRVTFDASRLSSGIYIYQLSGDNLQITKKMILMK